MKKYLIILMFCLISCYLKRENNLPIDWSPTVTQDIYLDQDFSNDEQEWIKYSFNEWFVASRGIIKLNFAGLIKTSDKDPYQHFNKNVIIRIKSDDPFIINMRNNQLHGSTPIGFHIVSDDQEHFVVGIIYDLIPNSVRYKLNVIHELGHAIGLKHIDDGPAILNTVQDKNLRCLTKTDLINFCNKYSCNYNETNYCSNYSLSNQIFH